ncbi:tRNA (cytidine(34)-2'-O)-methyltransferase [Spirulina sp. CS-785/01]|uniref:tRNA (cytidine(34)-2'-O)-methyltransferase n=1 Tax=Spirulina sp. CS-785/01 TaxID=3021716 RepID=UPI00232A8BFE|nr:tRNA (cytidine(34)-2'-O)-methyltransferase [Spirulina sp. CS-785/01]MDB9312592.1 tRNA (cytidine(34)-2'-O)-methyltransferase [Spirulina sp. CS-785/01]
MSPKIVLVHPQIPPNTGAIARTCAATETPLHLVAPLGFELSDRYLKRAGLDYWPHVDLHHHGDIDQFWAAQKPQGGQVLGFTVRGEEDYHQFSFTGNDWLLFGSETQGLPPSVLERCDRLIRIPINQEKVRSLNLSVSVAIALFEARRQCGQL